MVKTFKLWLASKLRSSADKLDPPPVTTKGGGGPGEEVRPK